jgi:hypothetical protein
MLYIGTHRLYKYELKDRDLLEDPAVYVRIILKWNLGKGDGCGQESSGTG